jgi:DNA-binding SARP family transcriptional activator/tetratricopeptide (TPR) repeat protein
VIRYGILGPIQLSDGERLLHVGGPRQVALLVYLLLHANRAVSSDQLIDALWADGSTGSAVKRLRVAIVRLRRSLEHATHDESALRTVGGGYLLEVPPNELDAELFRARVRDGQRALDENQPAAAARLLSEALELWRGPVLADVAYRSFAQAEIGRLEELRLSALASRIRAELQLGEGVALIGELRSLVAEHPTDEGLVGLLMLTLYRCGRQADALDVYQHARAYLATELGLQPGPTLTALQEEILQHAPVLDFASTGEPTPATEPDGIPLPALVARLGDAPLVGRTTELRNLAAIWQEVVRDGTHRILFLAGEPGVGKTSLATHFASRAAAEGATVLYGRADPDALIPYQPFVEAFGHLAMNASHAVLRGSAADAAELSRVVPEFRRRLPDVSSSPEVGCSDERYRLFSAAAAMLVAAAGDAPLLLVLDDLHWADRSSLRLLCHIARYSAPAPLLVLGTYRDSDVDKTPALVDTLVDLRRENLDERIVLTGLDEQAVGELIADTTDSAPPDLPRVLHRETRGNPFFLVEMLRHLADSNVLTCDGAGRLPADLLAQVGVPEGVRQVVARRLIRLSEPANEALTVGSILGPEFDLAVLAAVLEHPESELDTALDEGLDSGLLTEVDGAPGRFSFSHALIRETLYRRPSAMRRAVLHARAGSALELLSNGNGQHIADIARHFVAAGARGDPERALRYSIAAAEQATGRLAHDEAAAHYARALSGTAPIGDAERCELLLALGNACWCTGDMERARAACLQAAELAEALGDPSLLGRAALSFAGPIRYEPAATRAQPIARLLETALSMLGDAQSPLRAQVMARLAAVLVSTAQEDRKRALARDATTLVRRLGDRAALADVLATSLFATRGPDNLDERLATNHELAQLAAELEDRRLEAFTHAGFLDDLLELGDVDTLERELQALERVAQVLGERFRLWLATLARARGALLDGRLQDCEALAEQALQLGLEGQDESAAQAYGAQMVHLRREQGRLDELTAMVEAQVELYPDVPAWRCGLAYVYAEVGRELDARRELEVLGNASFSGIPRDAYWLTGMALLSEVVGVLGGHDSAERMYDLLTPFADRHVVTTPHCLGSVSHPLGVLATACERFDAAAEHFEQALRMNAQIRSPLWVAHTQYAYGRMLIERDRPCDRAHTERLLGGASATAQRLSLTAVGRRLSELRRTTVKQRARPRV